MPASTTTKQAMLLFSVAASASARRCNSKILADPFPVSEDTPRFPQDAYSHQGAPFEWWYWVGKLESSCGRRFGFSAINNGSPAIGFAAATVAISDVDADDDAARYYERTTVFTPPVQWDPATWAEADPSAAFSAELGDPSAPFTSIAITDRGQGYAFPPQVVVKPCAGSGAGEGAAAIAFLNTGNAGEEGEPGQLREIVLVAPGAGYDCVPEIELADFPGAPPPLLPGSAEAIRSFISMSSAEADEPFRRMHLKANATDTTTGKSIQLELTGKQPRRRDPILMFGDGVVPVDPSLPEAPGSVIANNFYYALTDIKTEGTLTIGDETFEVSGRTWRDHQFGGFPFGAKWVLQHIQLQGGVRLSAVRVLEEDVLPEADTPLSARVSVQVPKRVCRKHAKDRKTKRACKPFNMYEVDATFVLDGDSLFESERTGSKFYTNVQLDIPEFHAHLKISSLFDDQEQASNFVYEGLGEVEGVFLGKHASGDAWLEQTATSIDAAL